MLFHHFSSRCQNRINLAKNIYIVLLPWIKFHINIHKHYEVESLFLLLMSDQISFEYDAPEKAIDRIKSKSDSERSQYIIDIFVKYFGDGIKQNPKAFSGRFRKMASTAFNFYRGSALLFYQDLKIDQDQWIKTNKSAGNMFIHVTILTIQLNRNKSILFRVIYMLKISVHI